MLMLFVTWPAVLYLCFKHMPGNYAWWCLSLFLATLAINGIIHIAVMNARNAS